MSEIPEKKIDESWKEQVEQEKKTHAAAKQPAAPGTPEAAQGFPEARFDVFLSGLALEALVALGDAPHPVTNKPAQNLAQARYLIDLLGILEDKTRDHVTVEEERLLKDTLYQLRMRYLAKTGG